MKKTNQSELYMLILGSKGGATWFDCLVLLGLLAILFIINCGINYWQGRHALSNEDYVGESDDKGTVEYLVPFVSGIWSSQYYQYEKWHGPHFLRLDFELHTSKITGSGSDDVGKYSIEGIYSVKSNRIGLIKTYRKGTGDPKQNLGHRVTIQLAWNSNLRIFQGKWYVWTYKYGEQDKFHLEFAIDHRQNLTQCTPPHRVNYLVSNSWLSFKRFVHDLDSACSKRKHDEN
jgi:hypothetical protein